MKRLGGHGTMRKALSRSKHNILFGIPDWTFGTNFIFLVASFPVKENSSVPGPQPSISLDLQFPVSYQLFGPSHTVVRGTLLTIIPSCW